jgi:acetyl-CoA carboxylase biotin carboxyl carrier protein
LNPTLHTAELLAQIGREHELAEIDYEDASVKIHITFDPPPAPQAPSGFDPTMFARMANGGPTTLSQGAAEPSKPAELGETINSPLAGVFYRAPRPDADAFVDDGSNVTAGQVLCIVEAMKLMNEITADRPCKIVRILVENAEAVEEGQPLFQIA